jgi:ESF2/ABP1 family protein
MQDHSILSDQSLTDTETIASNASLRDTDDEFVSDNDSLNLDPTSVLSLENLQKHSASIDASGVVYLSRIPPFMKPTQLRSLLSKYGKLGRIYLAPEDIKITARRKKYKHNKRINYTEGWVEFLDKKVARATASHLNNNIIGGKKRSYYYDDIWVMKYLPKFKWNHLTEQIAYELVCFIYLILESKRSKTKE